MDILVEIFDLLSVYIDLVIELILPYKLEIIMGLFITTFFLGFIYSYK